MRTFDVEVGANTFELDDAGAVTKGSAKFGAWSTNPANQVVITKTGGGETLIDVDRRFDNNYHICCEKEGAQLFDFNGDDASAMPGLRVGRAILFVKPICDAPFRVRLRPKWDLALRSTI